MEQLKKSKIKVLPIIIWAGFWVIIQAITLIVAVRAADVGGRYKSVKSFKDDRSVSDVNDNFRRVTLNLIDDKGFNVPVGNGTTSMTVQLASVQTDTGFGIFAQTTWNSSIRVTAKTTTSFTVTYTDPASTTQTLDWILAR